MKSYKTLQAEARKTPYYNAKSMGCRLFRANYLSDGPRYYALMRMIGRNIAPAQVEAPSQRVFLSRSLLGPGMRSLRPETEQVVESLFEKRGFKVFHPEKVLLDEQVSVIRDAKWLAGLVGSQLHLAVFSTAVAPRLFRICPSFHASKLDGTIMHSLGGSLYHFQPADFGRLDAQEQHLGQFQRSWDISPEDLLRLEAEIDKWLES